MPGPPLILNPILNSPFEEPTRHFRFTEDGITDEVVEARRVSGYFVPIAQPKKKGKQLALSTQWTQDRFRESEFINRVRERVGLWRRNRWPGVTATSARLLEHWTDPSRERKLFFCQVEALETAIYLTEVAGRQGDGWIETSLREANELANPGLFRIAFKMATGSGKTVVMGMLIAWQALNKLANPQDARFSDTFLLVAPGITIRDRLRVLLPSDPESYYRQRDLLPVELADRLGQAPIAIVNFHAFLRREKVAASRLTKTIARAESDAFTESPAEMVRRVCRDLGNKRNLVVINDEAHHCYRRRPAAAATPPSGDEPVEEKLTGEERREAQRREAEARVWISGLEAVRDKLGLRAVYDLSATPFFLRGSGYPEGTLFPWVVSDFSLIDAIESGVVKVPRVPISDDAMTGGSPTYRDLWPRIRDELPRKGRGTETVSGDPKMPAELEGALRSLYGNYEKAHAAWAADPDALAQGRTPPVFIVVCNNTNVSKLVFDWIAGWEKRGEDGEPLLGSDSQPMLVPGRLPIFSNVVDGSWSARPATILVDSEQLESGEAMSPELVRMLAVEIEEWKAEVRARFPGRDVEELTDEDLLREVMNTVGKPGKLGAEVKCVVSVSMLTEGWDANTVTHILGVRAFGTQLLCEQVVGRGLRRMSYAVDDEGLFEPEYAEVYGVPFSFIPTSGSTVEPPKPKPTTRVRALDERAACEITFPRLTGYRYEVGEEPLAASWSAESRMSVSTAEVPSITENAPIVGEHAIHDLAELARQRRRTVEYELARRLAEHWFAGQPWRFPELRRLAARWIDECLELGDGVFLGYLLLAELRDRAAEKIYRAIPPATGGEARLVPILAPYDVVGSTRHVDFDTTRPVWPADPGKCHVSHVVADTKDWEQKVAQALEGMPEVLRYVKNTQLGFAIPYAVEGHPRRYQPDYIAHLDDGRGAADPLQVVIEVTGRKDVDKEAKVDTARNLWVPAVNAEGSFGRWAFLEVNDPWKCQRQIRDFLAARAGAAAA